MGSGVCGQWEGGARRRKIDRRGWDLPVDGKGSSDMGGGGRGVCGPGGFGKNDQDGQDGPRKTFQDTQGIDVAPRG